MNKTLRTLLSMLLVVVICVQTFTACSYNDNSSTSSSTTSNRSDNVGGGSSTIIDNNVYTITYIGAPTNNNPTTYTAKDTVVLKNPSWPGMSFSHWSDTNGNAVEVIAEGTTGNITLIANWKYIENFAVSNNSNEIALSIFNDELNAYQFVYDLGSINNVVLDELSSYKYNGTTNHTWSISETVSFTESNAKNVASTISKSVTSSNSWSSTISSVKSASTSYDASLSMNFEMGSAFNILKTSIGASFGVGTESGTSDTTSNTTSGSSGSTSGQSETVSSTLTYISDTTTQITRSETLTPELSPAGLYRYVHAGDIKVFAVITYDAKTQNYYINIFSCIVRTYETMLYETVSEYDCDVTIVESDSLEFDIDVETIANEIIGNSYYITFDANGGQGTMPNQLVLPNSTVALYKNQFTKANSTFVGWRVVDGDKNVVYLDEQSIYNLGSPKETVHLEAIWSETEPVWVVSDSGSFYYADIPSTVDMSHSVFKNMKTEAYVEYETETSKRVVTIQWGGYVYWHWMYDTSSDGTATRAIYHKKGTGPDNGYGYKYFFAFMSSKGNYESDKYYCNSQGLTNYIVTDQKTSNKDCGGALRWFRFDYYICTYTDYIIEQ